MSWDLFTAAEAARREAEAGEPRAAAGRGSAHAPSPLRNEELAHAVASGLAERGGRSRAAEEWTVTQVNAALGAVLDGVFPPLWVSGEITSFTRARSGHCYFTLRDEQSQLRCVMWRDEARRLPTAPAEGMQVRALGRLAVYPSRGELQLVVAELEGRGDGLWKLALERLRARLQAEGLTDPARKRPLPRCPAAVGVVTSPTGAVLHDITTVVRRRAPWTRLVLAGCRVQGEGAAAEIAAAIRLFARARCVDVLIVGRGGGSVEDLWAFNEEEVARAIAESPIPVISAVGHETDVTIADLVADLRAPTPSAAAEAAVPDGVVLADGVRAAANRLHSAVQARLLRGRGDLERCAATLDGTIERTLAARRDRLGAAARHLHALSPLAAFNRGFAVPLGSDGRVMRRAESFREGEAFDLMVYDGVVPCRVDRRDAAAGEGAA